MVDIKEHIVGHQLDFRVKLFNIMAVGGIIMSFFTAIQSIFMQKWDTLLVSNLMMIISICLLTYAVKSGRYYICYVLTIIFIFIIFFPILFFQAGGYKSGVPAVFIFAVLFTVLMLEGIRGIVISVFELILYSSICYIAYIKPETVTWYTDEKTIVIDIIFTYTAIGIICGTVLYFHIKEYAYQRELLKKQNEQLKYYDEVKSTFLTTVAHEIKNPLNIVGLYAQDTYELASEKNIDLDQIMSNQKTIEKTVIRLDRIVVDLIDTASIEQGKVSLSIAPVDTVALIKEAVSFWTEKDKKELKDGNRVVLNLCKDSAPIMADYSRIFQVLINLLSNASRYTKNGIIRISLKDTDKCQVISVEDNGEGMDPEVKKKVFKGYVSTSKDYWRHGIGLYICHQIVKAHGGDIWIESELGIGTKISFSIPYKGV